MGIIHLKLYNKKKQKIKINYILIVLKNSSKIKMVKKLMILLNIIQLIILTEIILKKEIAIY